MKPSPSKLFYSSRKELAHQYLQQNIACSMREAYSGSTAGRATHAFEDTNFVVKALQYRRTRKVRKQEEHWKQIMKKIVQWWQVVVPFWIKGLAVQHQRLFSGNSQHQHQPGFTCFIEKLVFQHDMARPSQCTEWEKARKENAVVQPTFLKILSEDNLQQTY